METVKGPVVAKGLRAERGRWAEDVCGREVLTPREGPGLHRPDPQNEQRRECRVVVTLRAPWLGDESG